MGSGSQHGMQVVCTLELNGCMKDQDLTHRLCWEWLAEEEVFSCACSLASFPGHSQILSRSRGEKSGFCYMNR